MLSLSRTAAWLGDGSGDGEKRRGWRWIWKDEDEGCVCSPAVSVMGVAGVELCRSDCSHQLVKKHREP
jgi:hypothetical protein